MSVDLEELQSDSKSESSETTSSGGYVERLIAGPGLSLLAMALVSLATWTAFQAGNPEPFMLYPPYHEAWWRLPLSVYAHQNMSHLVGNAMMVAVAGGLVALFTSVVRYHVFFVISGILAGIAQVSATAALGEATPVLGASGAALALLGYLITGNDISTWVLDRAPRWVVAVVVAGVALALTLRYSGLAVANVAHLAGAVIGLVAGQFNLLQRGS